MTSARSARPARTVRWCSRRWCSRAVVGTLVVAGLLAGAPPSAWAGGEQQPTEQQVTAARIRARQLRSDARRQTGDVASATAALDAAAADSALALETYRAAVETRRDALAELGRREATLADAEASVAAARAELVRWARVVYEDGGTLGASPGVYTLFAGGDTDDVATHREWLRRAGRDRADVLGALRTALDHRQRVTDEAGRAADVAAAAAAQADAASAARDAVLDAQRRRLADLQLLLSGTRDAAAAAERSAGDLGAAHAAAGVYPGHGSSSANRVTGPVGDCAGGDVSAYGNGRIPLSALCPLRGASGGLLRADAAYAFNQLAGAYAGRFGRQVCVTDSYRSYDEQVRVRAERPGLAAVPGRSNHGWDTAVDLCGGIERFDSAEHAWMRLNAPLFGWFDPAWARQGGTLPEPWHWEFAA